MLFSYASSISRDFPELATRVLRLEALTPAAPAAMSVAHFFALARQRIALTTKSDLPSVHPLVDLCNAVSVAFAIPIAAIDLDRIGGNLQVRPAVGTETYETFAGDIERPEVGEVIFADDSHRAHARRWTNRQSGHSAITGKTTNALIVVEAMHETAGEDVARLTATLRKTISGLWPTASTTELQVR